MTQSGDAASLVGQLRQACIGHPFAKIEWPHRLLHEAADTIEAMATCKPPLQVQTLAETLAERHKTLMLQTEQEAFAAAQCGDKARQSIASTESERHRAVYHAISLILDDQRRSIDHG